MSAENDLEVARQLGSLTATLEAQGILVEANHRDTLAYISDVEKRLTSQSNATCAALTAHVEREEGRLKSIEDKLSLTRFLWLTIKAVVMTIALIFAMKTGNISDVWKHWKELI